MPPPQAPFREGKRERQTDRERERDRETRERERERQTDRESQTERERESMVAQHGHKYRQGFTHTIETSIRPDHTH